MSCKVLIITGANTAREVNLMGEKPDFRKHIGMYIGDFEDLPHYKQKNKVEEWEDDVKLWQAAESSLKEYRIHGVYLKNSLPDRLTRWNRLHISTVEKLYPIGSTHKFEVSEETLTAIIL